MQNLIPKLKQTSIISRKPGFLSEKLKTLTSETAASEATYGVRIESASQNNCH